MSAKKAKPQIFTPSFEDFDNEPRGPSDYEAPRPFDHRGGKHPDFMTRNSGVIAYFICVAFFFAMVALFIYSASRQ